MLDVAQEERDLARENEEEYFREIQLLKDRINQLTMRCAVVGRVSSPSHLSSTVKHLCVPAPLFRRDGLQLTIERQQAEILEIRMLLDSERTVSAQWQERALAADGA